MTASLFLEPVDVRPVEFAVHKYGQELLVDVAWIKDMPAFRHTVDPYSLNFYDVTLITGGKGSFWLDEQEYQLVPNQILFTTPGQIRRWYVSGLEGICLFFPANFLLDHYNDPLLLHRMRFFHTHAGPRNLVLTAEQQATLLERLSAMHQEIQHIQGDSADLLRSICYEILVYLNRWYTQVHNLIIEKPFNFTVSRFRQYVDKYFNRHHKVCEYAALLAVTPGHLNVLCKDHLGRTASQIIQDRVFCEASRQLIHSPISIEALSEALGFNNTSYFCKAFKRHVGFSPLQFRKRGRIQE